MNDARVVVLPSAEGRAIDLLAGPGSARVIVGPHMGAEHRTMCRLELEPGSSTRTLRHPSEAVWYVVSGHGKVLRVDADPLSLEPGAMVHVGPASTYTLRASDAEALVVVGGPSPPDPELGRAEEPLAESGGEVRLFHRDRPSRRLPMISSDARLVVWPGVGAHTANMNYVRLEPGEENRPHSHPVSEDTIVILSGRGSVDDLTNGETHEFHAGDVIHVPIGLEHRVKADRGEGVVSVGGPCPPDTVMLAVAEQA
jgi:quercetin dioxygenase-like cupin family protein